ncbi:MAG: hypothetical protein EP343_16290 [Deltaproteobacteria bacterium]|nr:MAG: hypothetical protein EP343_16290 [Deltaproteobacteria bacterium]
MKDVQENEALLGEHFGEERILFLVDMRNIQSMSKEARKYLSRSDIGLYATAVALLVRSPLSKFFGNLIMNFSKPHYPTKIFTSEQEAVLWLHQRSPTSQEDTA